MNTNSETNEIDDIESTSIIKNSLIDETETVTTVAVIPFTVNEVVWGKIRGWAHWPAKIIRIENRRYVVEWFNDYRSTSLFKSQIFKFYPNFSLFADKFNSTVGLKDAAHEAMLYLKSQKKN